MLKKKTKADHPFLQDKLFREFIAWLAESRNVVEYGLQPANHLMI